MSWNWPLESVRLIDIGKTFISSSATASLMGSNISGGTGINGGAPQESCKALDPIILALSNLVSFVGPISILPFIIFLGFFSLVVMPFFLSFFVKDRGLEMVKIAIPYTIKVFPIKELELYIISAREPFHWDR